MAFFVCPVCGEEVEIVDPEDAAHYTSTNDKGVARIEGIAEPVLLGRREVIEARAKGTPDTFTTDAAGITIPH